VPDLRLLEREKKWLPMEKRKVEEEEEASIPGGDGIGLFERRYVVSV